MAARSIPARFRREAIMLGVLLSLLVGGCAGADEPAATTAAAPTLPAEDAAAPGAIWPGTGQARLEELRASANRGQRPDLLDPVKAARTYLTTALPPEARGAAPGITLGPFRATSRDTGEVTARGRRMAQTTVSLRRYDGPRGSVAGQKPIWYVQGLGSPDLAILDADYDGSRLIGALVPDRMGEVVMRTSALDGTILDQRSAAATKGRLIQIDVAAQNQPGVIFTAVLTGRDGVSSMRAFRIGAPGP
jgi:hypothetical protein